MDGDRFIVLDCDGIFYVLTRQQVVDFINEKLDHLDLHKGGHSAAIRIFQDLCDRCIAKAVVFKLFSQRTPSYFLTLRVPPSPQHLILHIVL